MSIVLLGLLHLALFDDPGGDPATGAQKAREKAHHALLVESFEDESAGRDIRWEYFAPRFLKEAEANPGDFVGFDALFWLVTAGNVDRPEFSKATALLTRHHAKGVEIQSLCCWFVSPMYFATASESVEGLLREVIATNPDRAVQAEACFSLSQYLSNKAEFARLLGRPEGDDLARRIGDCWGRHYLARLKECDLDKLSQEASRLFNRGRLTYPQYWANHLVFGQRAPEIKRRDLDGKLMALSDHRCKVVVLSFWATWCVPCVAMLPYERSLVERLAGKPFVLLGVVSDTDRSKVKKMVEDKHITWRSWWNAEGAGTPLSNSWGVRGWPTLYILDHRGVIRYKNIRGSALDFAIDALLIATRESKATVHDPRASESPDPRP